MPTIFNKLEENSEDHSALYSIYGGTFLKGECYAFAIALHQGLGWPIIGLMKGDVIWHTGVRSPDGLVHDVRGLNTEDDFGGYFISQPLIIKDVSVGDLHATRTIDDHVIERARRFAEVMWPDLPWLNSTASKVIAFADELEILCREHKLWIGGVIPTMLPRVFMGKDDEGGYKVAPIANGSVYTINRYLA